jgi:hypothetical protein
MSTKTLRCLLGWLRLLMAFRPGCPTVEVRRHAALKPSAGVILEASATDGWWATLDAKRPADGSGCRQAWRDPKLLGQAEGVQGQPLLGDAAIVDP